MSQKCSKKPGLLYEPEAGPQVWLTIKRHLEEERQALREIRSDQGLAAARTEQDYRLLGIDDTDLMEQMFVEGQMRNPEAARLIERTRLSYYNLLDPLPNLEEERVKELRFIQKKLLTALWELQKQVQKSFQDNNPLVITLDLESAEEVLKKYQDMSGTSPRVSRLVQEIKTILDDLNLLSKQFSR